MNQGKKLLVYKRRKEKKCFKKLVADLQADEQQILNELDRLDEHLFGTECDHAVFMEIELQGFLLLAST